MIFLIKTKQFKDRKNTGNSQAAHPQKPTIIEFQPVICNIIYETVLSMSRKSSFCDSYIEFAY